MLYEVITSQTLHIGDIETNYTYEKAQKVKKASSMVSNYIHRFKGTETIGFKRDKMVLAVGAKEIERLRERYQEFKTLYPYLELWDEEQLRNIEPRITSYNVCYTKLLRFSLPRIEEKTGEGHRGFTVSVDGTLSFANAARRRDFTVNALGYDIHSQTFLDPFGGREDMEKRVLRHIDVKTFVEDPLRVYRAVQFAARFGYTLAEETKILCQKMVDDRMLASLPKERIYIA